MNKLLTREEVRARVLAQVEALEAAKGAFMRALTDANLGLSELCYLHAAKAPEYARTGWHDCMMCEGAEDEAWLDDVAGWCEESARDVDKVDPCSLDSIDKVIAQLRKAVNGENPEAEGQGGDASPAVAE